MVGGLMYGYPAPYDRCHERLVAQQRVTEIR